MHVKLTNEMTSHLFSADTVPNVKMSVNRVSIEAVKLSCLISGGQVQHLVFQRKYSVRDEFDTIAGISIINKTCEYKTADQVTCLCLTANEVVCIILVHRNETEHSWKCSSLVNGHLFGSNIVNASGVLRGLYTSLNAFA